jgi:hypothetical protein
MVVAVGLHMTLFFLFSPSFPPACCWCGGLGEGFYRINPTTDWPDAQFSHMVFLILSLLNPVLIFLFSWFVYLIFLATLLLSPSFQTTLYFAATRFFV